MLDVPQRETRQPSFCRSGVLQDVCWSAKLAASMTGSVAQSSVRWSQRKPQNRKTRQDDTTPTPWLSPGWEGGNQNYRALLAPCWLFRACAASSFVLHGSCSSSQATSKHVYRVMRAQSWHVKHCLVIVKRNTCETLKDERSMQAC